MWLQVLPAFTLLCLSLQDSTLASSLMKNTPAAVACFVINVLVWGGLAYRSDDKADEGRTQAVFGGSLAAQTAARRLLSLAPLPAPWGMVSGDAT